MITQHDIHNAIVESCSPAQKAYLSIQCGNDPEKIKDVEKCAAKALNIAINAFNNAGIDYLNTKL